MAKRKPPPRRHRHQDDRPRHGETVWLYGLHTVAAALTNPARKISRIVLTEEAAGALADPLTSAAPLARPAPETVARGEIDAVLPAGAVHQGAAILADPLLPADFGEILADSQPGAVVVLLDQPSDPRNVGAVMRSAAAFSAACVAVPDRHAPEATAVLAKAASGALDRLPLVRVGNVAQAMEQMKSAGFWCVGLTAEATTPIAGAATFDKTALIVGAEGRGLRRLTAENCDLLVRIPISPGVESLNMSAAAAIALYEVRRAAGESG
jgi:23S rRNA (guanosine2251-2'-O)-methyltransferase